MLEPLSGTRENRHFGLEADFHRRKNPSGTVSKRVKTTEAEKKAQKAFVIQITPIVQMYTDYSRVHKQVGECWSLRDLPRLLSPNSQTQGRCHIALISAQLFSEDQKHRAKHTALWS